MLEKPKLVRPNFNKLHKIHNICVKTIEPILSFPPKKHTQQQKTKQATKMEEELDVEGAISKYINIKMSSTGKYYEQGKSLPAHHS